MIARALPSALLLATACDVTVPPDTAESADAWHATGHVVFVEEHGPPDFRVASLDLETREVRTLFALPAGAFAYDLDVSPVDGTILLAYSEPAAPGEDGFDRSVVVALGDDGPSRWVAGEAGPGAWALYPRWSADAQSVWYVAQTPSLLAGGVPHALLRADAGSGETTATIDWATEPAVAPDGEHLAYIAVDPVTTGRSLQLADVDGRPLLRLIDEEEHPDLAHPLFSADGRELYVFVVADSTPRSWSFAVDPSPLGHGAHLAPGDWFAIPIEGGSLRRLTSTATVHYGAATGDDASVLVTASQVGIDLVAPKAKVYEQLLFNRAVRSLAWQRD
ncbi:MAG: hypothetical protein AAF721_22875 [Myxococcota bacterium]